MFLAGLINDLTNNNLLVGLWGRLCLSHKSLHQDAVSDKFTIIAGEAEKVVKPGSVDISRGSTKRVHQTKCQHGLVRYTGVYSVANRAKRTAEVLEWVGLTERARELTGQLSADWLQERLSHLGFTETAVSATDPTLEDVFITLARR